VALGYFNCEFERSASYHQRALDILWESKNLWGIATTKSSLAYFCYYMPGNINLQFQTTGEALRIAEESGDIYSKAISYVTHGVSFYGKGLLEEAERNLLKGLEFCERINFIYWMTAAQFHLGEIFFEIGDFSKSKEFYKKGVGVLESKQLFPSWVGVGKSGLARSKVMDREKDVDLDSLYTCSRNNKANVHEGWIQRYIGEILLNVDDQHISESEHWIQKAIEADQKNRMMFHLGQDYALYAELFKRKGDRLKAREILGKAIEILKECGADGWVEKYEKELFIL
jgi:tetratricopeptide (TPR) repeat protein